MKKVFLYSILLVAGLAFSQALPALGGSERAVREVLRVLTMIALGFVMIRVGLEFELDRSRRRDLAVDYGVALFEGWRARTDGVLRESTLS